MRVKKMIYEIESQPKNFKTFTYILYLIRSNCMFLQVKQVNMLKGRA